MSGTLTGSLQTGDSSIPLRAGQGVTPLQNPLDMLGKATAIQNAMNTGQIQKQTIQSNTLSLAQQQKQLAYAHLLPGLLNGSIKDMASLTTALGGLEHYGINTQPFLADMVQTASAGGDPVENFKQQALAGVQPPEKAAGAILPEVSGVDQGLIRQNYLTPRPGMPGAGEPRPVGAPVPLGASPAQQGTLVEYTTNDGVKHVEPWAKFNIDNNNGIVTGPGRWTGGPSAGQPATSAPGAINPRYAPAAPVGTGNPNAPVQIPPPGGSGMTSVSGPTPGTEEAMKGSAGQYVADRAAAGSYASRVLPLKQMIGLLDKGVQTGPGSEPLNQMRSFMISMANQGLLPKSITPDVIKQADFDELRKYSSQYITGIPFAGGSNAKMAEAISGSPNTGLATLANKDLSRVLVGVDRFRTALPILFDQEAQKGAFSGGRPANPNQVASEYASWAAKQNQQLDPRAFLDDLLTQQKRGAMWKKMTPAEQDKYIKSLKVAHSIPGLME